MSVQDRIRFFENTSNIDECICTICSMIFRNDDEYDEHECSDVVNAIPTVNSNEEGFPCPLCSNRYMSPNILGEHFYSSHNSYDDMLILDDKIVRNGFPGFNTLEYINMISFLDDKEVELLIEKEESCFICTEEYVPYVKEYDIIANKDDIDGYASDSAFTDHRRSLIINKYIDMYNDSEKKYIENHDIIILKDDRLIEAYNNCRLKEHSPIRLSCCKNIICLPCLQNHLTQTDSLKCPFCKKDHTMTSMDYVVYIEEVNEIDKSRWIPWWRKHLDIFL